MKNKTVLYISEDTINAHQVNGKKDITVQWIPETFTAALKTINKKLSLKNARILLSESISYISLIDVPEPDIKDRKKIQAIAQEVIPEQLESTSWDYMVVEKTIPKSKAQIIATTNDITKILQSAIKELNIKFDVIEPISYSLAQLTKSSRDPQIIIHEDKTVVIAHKGKVYASAIPDIENIDKQLAQLISFVYETYAIEPNKVFLSSTSEDHSTVNVGIADNRVIKTIIDPFTEIALKADLKNSDEDLLNIIIQAQKKVPIEKKKVKKQKEEVSSESEPGVNKSLIRLLIFVLLLSPILIGIMLLGRDDTPKVFENTDNLESISDAVNQYRSYSILIKDNSNSQLAAKNIKDKLLEMGFQQITIEKSVDGLVENTSITIDYKESVPTDIYDDIESSLSYYTVLENELLTEESMYDLVLTLGTFN